MDNSIVSPFLDSRCT